MNSLAIIKHILEFLENEYPKFVIQNIYALTYSELLTFYEILFNITRLPPKNMSMYFNYCIGYYYLTQRDYKNAKEYLLLSVDTICIGIHSLLAYISDILNEPKQMFYYAKKAIENKDNLINNILGVYYWNENRYDTAKKYFEIGCNMNDPICIFNLGLYYDEIQGNIPFAIDYYKSSLKLNYYYAASKLSEIYMKLNDNTLYKKYRMIYLLNNNNLENVLVSDVYLLKNQYIKLLKNKQINE